MSDALAVVMLGVARGHEPRLARFLGIPHRFVGEAAQRQAVDAVISLKFGAAEARSYAPRLLQLPGAGADAVDFASVPPQCTVCNVFEHEVPIAEYGMAAILAHAIGYLPMVRDFSGPAFAQQYAARRPHAEVRGKTLGLVGFGHIGRELARRARAFGMQVQAVTRSGHAADADRSYTPEHLCDMLRTADFVFIACPLTEETRHLIGAAELAVMKPTAVIINVSRGPILEEEALYRALAERRIGGATLDVWYQYPTPTVPGATPSRFPFEQLPNVHCTPHSSGWTEEMFDRRFALIADNLTRLREGRPLLNVIHPARSDQSDH